jgi:hypothetical protein
MLILTWKWLELFTFDPQEKNVKEKDVNSWDGFTKAYVVLQCKKLGTLFYIHEDDMNGVSRECA